MNKSKGMMIAGAAAALFLSGAVTARAGEEKKGGDQVMCSGINACKGQGACAGAGHSCGGQNACKGKGVIQTTAEECKAKGGKPSETKH
jgi:hypothetical protein